MFDEKLNSCRTSKCTCILKVPPNFPSKPPFPEALYSLEILYLFRKNFGK
jgi:hypothetical protein